MQPVRSYTHEMQVVAKTLPQSQHLFDEPPINHSKIANYRVRLAGTNGQRDAECSRGANQRVKWPRVKHPTNADSIEENNFGPADTWLQYINCIIMFASRRQLTSPTTTH